MQIPLPLTRDLVLIGGGHSHALVLRMWGMNPLPGVRVTVINPDPTAPYTGMLPGYVAGHYQRDDLDIDLVQLARFANARIIKGRVDGIDTAARTVSLQDGRRIGYHIASVDIGITSDLPTLDGFEEFGTAAKPLGRYAAKWEAFRQSAIAGDVPPDIAVMGGGVGGVELSLAMQHALVKGGVQGAVITLIDNDTLLKGIGNNARKVLLKTLEDASITVRDRAKIASLSSGKVNLDSGESIAANFIVGAAGARPQDWLKDTGIDLTDGFVTVDRMLRSTNTPEVFAAGDCAYLSHSPRPKAGVFAVRQAPVLFHNLRAVLSGGDLREFKPQKDYLKLVSLGRKSALADKWGMQVGGPTLWKLKDRIDRKFMNQFLDLKPMKAAALPEKTALGVTEALGNKQLCGGCGAKVGGTVLAETLAKLPTVGRDDVLSKPGDDAAILGGADGKRQVLTTDHLRAFTNDPGLMARIAAVHALGDIWAMGATAQVAVSTLILPHMSLELQREFLSEIMNEAGDVFAAEGAEIVGGHTSMGAELTIGFTVTGLCDTPITLAGARVGDVLLLTKPIGSGTILAAEMAIQAKGSWVTRALEIMARPQGDAAKILTGAHAMTDVTGFGLAGHLKGIAAASGVGIEIDLDAVAFMDGAIELAESGVKSTIYPDNRALVPELDPGEDARAKLLFDPQTAGGLVAAVSLDMIDKIISELNALGYDAHVVGRCVEGHVELSLA